MNFFEVEVRTQIFNAGKADSPMTAATPAVESAPEAMEPTAEAMGPAAALRHAK
jgi:hypothetical protein